MIGPLALIDLEPPSWGQWWASFARVHDSPRRWHDFHWHRSYLYEQLVAMVALKIWASPTPYFFQTEPNLRIQPTGGTAVPWHKDSDFGHLDAEYNVWLPLTEITDNSQCCWLELAGSTRERSAVTPIRPAIGQAAIFRGAVLRHGNFPNQAAERRSFDFRLVAQEDFTDRNIQTFEYGRKLSLGDYWRAP